VNAKQIIDMRASQLGYKAGMPVDALCEKLRYRIECVKMFLLHEQDAGRIDRAHRDIANLTDDISFLRRLTHSHAGNVTPHDTPMEAIIERVCRQPWIDNQTKRKTPWKPFAMACKLADAVAKERAKAKPALKKVKRDSIKRMITRYFDKHPNMPKT
jgi:hypothetical protein